MTRYPIFRVVPVDVTGHLPGQAPPLLTEVTRSATELLGAPGADPSTFRLAILAVGDGYSVESFIAAGEDPQDTQPTKEH